MQILGLESSCDETGIAIIDLDRGLLAHAVHSQVDLHARYGGVVPELASRDHISRIPALIGETLQAAGLRARDLDGVAYTAGPGLAGALLTGAVAARSYAWGLGIPALAVHHMEGHLLSPLLEERQPQWPFVCLLVSGGHTQLVRVDGVGRYRLLGDTLDDAAGEALDKTAKLLGLPYPGGAPLERLAREGDAGKYRFPRPMTDRPGLDFSFSGLKTAAITTWQQYQDVAGARADIAASFQAAMIDTLRIKCQRALQQEQLRTLVVSGGVSANRCLRDVFDKSMLAAGGQQAEVFYPRLEFCTDNGAMIALAGALRLQAGEADNLAISVRPRWPLSDLSAI